MSDYMPGLPWFPPGPPCSPPGPPCPPEIVDEAVAVAFDVVPEYRLYDAPFVRSGDEYITYEIAFGVVYDASTLPLLSFTDISVPAEIVVPEKTTAFCPSDVGLLVMFPDAPVASTSAPDAISYAPLVSATSIGELSLESGPHTIVVPPFA